MTHRREMAVLPQNPLMTLPKVDAVDAEPPTSFMSTLSGLTSTVPNATAVRQRRKLWEFSSHLHCSIVGTCLSTAELRKIVTKCQGLSLKDLSDLTTHEAAVKVAAHHDAAGRLLHKALDRRHEASIKRFNKAQDTHAVRLLWDEALRSGDIPGAYWALLTHWETTDELIKLAFGDVHMLSHLVGAANRADIRRIAALEAERGELALKVEKQQVQLREAIVTRDATIQRLNAVLAEQIAQESRACPSIRPPEHADEITALRDLVASLQKSLASEVGRRERAEQRYELTQAALAKANTALAEANKRAQHLGEELAAAEAQLAPTTGSTDTESPHDLSLKLQGARLLYVGGRPGQVHRLRAFAEGAQAELLYHDGGMEERKGLLAGLVSSADAVFFPVDCISHDAAGTLKRLCRQVEKPYLPLRSASLTSFIAALHRFDRPALPVSLTP